MSDARKPFTILMADDDPDDRELTREAFAQSRPASDLRFVEDGEELLDYLHRRGKFADPVAGDPAARPEHAPAGRPGGPPGYPG